MEDCPYSVRHKKGLSQRMNCKLTNNYCPFVRYCQTKGNIVNTDVALKCKIRLKEGVTFDAKQ